MTPLPILCYFVGFLLALALLTWQLSGKIRYLWPRENKAGPVYLRWYRGFRWRWNGRGEL